MYIGFVVTLMWTNTIDCVQFYPIAKDQVSRTCNQHEHRQWGMYVCQCLIMFLFVYCVEMFSRKPAVGVAINPYWELQGWSTSGRTFHTPFFWCELPGAIWVFLIGKKLGMLHATASNIFLGWLV